MLRIGNCKIFIAPIFLLLNCLTAFGQEPAPAPKVEPKMVSISFSGQVSVNGAVKKPNRKRFYLIRGNREQNAELLKQIKETPVMSSDCYYANLVHNGRKISDKLFCWLKNNDDNCETPYCREVKNKEEAQSIPEFAVAYNQGVREYRQSILALKWLTTNLPDDIRIGFYQQQKPVMRQLIELARSAGQTATQAKNGSAKPGEGYQSIMTNRIGGAYFIDVEVAPPDNKKTETYLVTNLTPMVFGDTGYVWTCEIEVDPAKSLNVFSLKGLVTAGAKKCDIVTKKITETCTTPECPKPEEKPAAEKPTT